MVDFESVGYEFSPQLLDFIQNSGKEPVNLVSDVYFAIFGIIPIPLCHVSANESDKNRFYFYHTLSIGTEKICSKPFAKKKDSKSDCLNRTLQVLFDKFLGTKSCSTQHIQFGSDNTFYEIVKQLILSKFSSLIKQDATLLKADKVLAGIVMFNTFSKTFDTVSVSTGNKAIRGCFLSLQGKATHDCHAEIITRRGFIRFLYAQVATFLKNEQNSIFCKSSYGKLRIRNNLSFHLFINTAPCGDARIYSRENFSVNVIDSNAGKLRFKIENGMGAVLGTEADNPFFYPQTIDGLLAGERLKTMSCTDKMLKWNYLGIQGAIMSNLIDPIYLSTVVIGDAREVGRIQRGVDTRLQGIASSTSYSHHSPSIGMVQKTSGFQAPTKNLNISSNWNAADDTVEVLDSTTGLMIKDRKPSRLCKFELSVLFKKILFMNNLSLPSNYTYKDIKLMNAEYTNAASIFYEWINNQQLGYWQNKPADCELFLV